MSSEDIKNYAGAAKNVVYALGIVGAGLWTYHVFNMTLVVKNAEASLQKLQSDLQRRPLIHSDLTVSPIDTKDASLGTILEITVVLTNSGNTDATVNADEQSIRVARVQFKDNKVNSFLDPVYSGLYLVATPNTPRGMVKVGPIALLANHSKALSTVVTVPQAGLFIVNFAGRASANVEQRIEATLVEETKKEQILISADKYVYVGQQQHR